jgi:hydroxyacylglutathione hydrolase
MPTIIPIRAFADNYIWVIQQHGRAVVVDPGDASPVIEYLDREGIELCAIISTHRPVPVFGPATEHIPGRTRALVEGDTVTLPGIGLEFSVLDIPGHTSGHIACFGNGMVFCGDTLFAAGCGRLFEGTPAQMVASLDKLAALAPDTRVYCGHEYTVSNLRFALAVEPQSEALHLRLERDQAKRDRGEPTLPSTIVEERATNPFLRSTDAAVRAAAVRHAGRNLPDRVSVFAELRAWKNAF